MWEGQGEGGYGRRSGVNITTDCEAGDNQATEA